MSASESKLDILDYFDNWCDEFCNNGDVIICGDFNINVAKKTTYSERLLNTCNDYGLKQLVKNTTRYTNHSATIIDLCFSNLAANVNVSSDDKISDHYNIDITIPVSTISKENECKLISVWQNYTQINLLHEIEKWVHQWENVKNSDCETKIKWLMENLKMCKKC